MHLEKGQRSSAEWLLPETLGFNEGLERIHEEVTRIRWEGS